MNWTDRRELMRGIASGHRCIFPASVYDGIGARIAEDLGFEAMMLAGSVASFAVLGAPDLCVLTLTEFADQVHRISRAGKLPLLVDADHGYGNALNVRRTVEELETVGVAALTIEDTLLPSAFGANGRVQLISVEEGVGKLRAALASRQDPRMIVVARTGAPPITGVKDAIARLRAYETTGVDMLFLSGIKTRAELDEIAGAVRLPIILGNAPDDVRDADYLAARKVRIALQGHHPFWAAVNGVYETQRALRAGIKPKDLPNVAPPDLQKRLVRDADYRTWQSAFLS